MVSIDWDAVEQACFRSKSGAGMSQSELDLCKAAYVQDPHKYVAVSKKGHQRAMALVNPLQGVDDD